MHRIDLVGREQLQPEEFATRQRDRVWLFADRRKRATAEHLDRHKAGPLAEVELGRLRGLAQIDDAQQDLGIMPAQIGQHLLVGRGEEGDLAAGESRMRLADLDDPAHPVEQRGAHLALLGDIDDVVGEEPVLDRRQIEVDVIGVREPGVAVGRPLHRGAHPVAIAEERVVAHADLVAVINDRGPVQREQ